MIMRHVITPKRFITSTGCIIYVWILPLLAKINFTEKEQTSISGFISNPPATGAFAVLSYVPLITMWEYQHHLCITRELEKSTQNKLYHSICLFQFCYGLGMICNINYTPYWVCVACLVCFILSYINHSFLLVQYTSPSKFGDYLLKINCACFIILPFTTQMAYWGMECTCYTLMMLYTPLEIIYYLMEESEKNLVDVDEIPRASVVSSQPTSSLNEAPTLREPPTLGDPPMLGQIP